MNIVLEGRKLVNTVIKEQSAERIITTSIYDDGTEITYNQSADGVDVSSNRTLQVQEDGKTVKII